MYCDTDHSIQRLPTTALTEENMQTRAESRVTIPMDSQPWSNSQACVPSGERKLKGIIIGSVRLSNKILIPNN